MPIADIEQLLRQSMGLDAATVGASTVERAVGDRMKACSILDVEHYRDYLQGSASELQELTECVVVPETWFFRDEETFAALGRIGAEWFSRRPADILRALSVPCSTGEEPYTIAMSLRDCGLPRKQITVDAVDISQRALTLARRGIYGRNSFRSQDLAFRERHFHPVAAGYAITDWLLQAVRFHQGNLVKAQFPFPVSPYDVIFCRNVLIYFDRSTQELVMHTLASMLGSEGVLFVGPAEAFLATSCGFSSIGGAASFAFTKTAIKRPVPAPSPRIRNKRPPPTLLTVAPKPPRAKESETPPSALAEAHRLADQGRFADAAAHCERELSRSPSAEAYYLLGVLRDATGERESAADCFRRAVYLEPHHSEALAHLATVLDQQGDRSGAERLRARARRAHSTADPRKALIP